MGNLVVHAGDFALGNANVDQTGFRLRSPDDFWVGPEFIPLSRTVQFEKIDETAVTEVRGKLGAAIVGSLLLGPAGVLLGAPRTTTSKEVSFFVEFDDGRKLVGTVGPRTWIPLLANLMVKSHSPARSPSGRRTVINGSARESRSDLKQRSNSHDGRLTTPDPIVREAPAQHIVAPKIPNPYLIVRRP